MFLDYIKSGLNIILKPERSLFSATRIQIEPINDCNLRCLSCPRAKLIKEPQMMSLQKFQKIIDDIKPQYLTLSGLGETLLHPEIDKMIKYCTERGIFVNMTSNGTLLDAGRAQKICESGLDVLSISMDATDRETYKFVRGLDLWEALFSNLKNFISYRNQRGVKKPSVRTHFVIQAKNYEQLPKFLRLCHEAGVDAIYFQHLSLNSIEERSELLTSGLSKEKIISFLKDAHAAAAEIGFLNTNLKELIDGFDRYWEQYEMSQSSDGRVCPNPWFDAYINVDGQVQPCCAFAGPVTGAYFGNLSDSKFMDIYNSKAYRNFRVQIKRGVRPYGVCRRCHPVSVWDIFKMSKFIPGFLKKKEQVEKS